MIRLNNQKLSRPATRISKSESTRDSSSTTPFSVEDTKKQRRPSMIASKLLDYSKTLCKKISELAKHWEAANSRYLNLKTMKKTTTLILKQYKSLKKLETHIKEIEKNNTIDSKTCVLNQELFFPEIQHPPALNGA